MGTRGLYAYRHRGKYYVKYNHWDSYPSVLGKNLVATIPKGDEAFKAWLEKKRAYYDKEQLRIEKLLSEGAKINCVDSNGFFGYEFEPSERPPALDLFIEWVYVFDLDRLAFSVDNGAHFKLDNVPRGGEHPSWIRFLHADALRRRCLSPTTPREYIADMSPEAPQPSEDGLVVYEDCQPKLITPSELLVASQSLDTSEELAFGFAKNFILGFYSYFSSIAEYRPSDPVFSHIAAGLLYAASPGLTFIPADAYPTAQNVYRHRFIVPSSKDGHTFITANAHPNAQNFYRHPHIVPSSKDGDGDSDGFQFPDPSFDTETFFKILHQQFWFRGCLVRLATHLYIEENLKAEVGTIAKAIRAKAAGKYVAILFSVRHVVFVTISGNDVAHTAPLPIMDAFGHGTLEATLEHISVGLRLLVQLLRPPAYDTTPTLDGPPPGPHGGADPAKPVLPLDVVTHILRFVDNKTYVCCSSLSRAYRTHCIGQPRVGQYTLIRHTADNCFVARMGDGPNVNVKVSWSRPRTRLAHYVVYVRYAEGGYLVPLTLNKEGTVCITVSCEGEAEIQNEETEFEDDYLGEEAEFDEEEAELDEEEAELDEEEAEFDEEEAELDEEEAELDEEEAEFDEEEAA